MSRKGIQIDITTQYTPRGGGDYSTLGEGQSHFQNIKNTLRSHLDDGSQSDWMVSDIFQWNGNGTGDRAMAFVVRHNDGGTWTGHEWMFVASLGNSTYEYQSVQDYIGSSLNYLRNDNGNEVTNMVRTFMIYNQNGTSDSFDVNLAPDGTLLDGGDNPVGDFGSPLSNPYSSPSNFFPSHNIPKSIIPSELVGEAGEKVGKFILFDHTEKSVSMAYTDRQRPMVRSVVLSGQIIDPIDSNFDSNQAGFVSFTFQNAESTGQIKNSHCYSFDESGNELEFNILWEPSTFNTSNSPRSDGKFPWDTIDITSNELYKGTLKSTLVRIQGPEYSAYHQTFGGSNGPLIKWGRSLVFPYIANEPVWPHGPDPLNLRLYG